MTIKLKKTYTLEEIEAMNALGIVPDGVRMDCLYTISRTCKFLYSYKSRDGKLYKYNSINGKFSREFDPEDYTHGETKFIVLGGTR